MRFAPTGIIGGTRSRLRPSSRGTVLVLFLALVAVLATSLITTMAYTANTQTQVASLSVKRDQAYYAAEAGIQKALWKTKYGNWASSSYASFSGTLGNAAYSVSARSTSGGMKVTSVGSLLSASAPISSTATLMLSTHAPVPALELSANYSIGGTDSITGDLKISNALIQNGSLAVHAGNITSTSSVPAAVSVDSGYTKSTVSSLAYTAVDPIYQSLKNNAATQTLSINTWNNLHQLDFTQSSIGVIFIDGNVTLDTNITVVGSGTLVVSQGLSSNSTASFNGHNVNFVCAGNLNANGSTFVINGSLYIEQGISANARTFSVTGVVLGNSTLNTQSGCATNIIVATPPWFDPRLSGGGSTAVIGNFTGPIFDGP